MDERLEKLKNGLEKLAQEAIALKQLEETLSEDTQKLLEKSELATLILEATVGYRIATLFAEYFGVEIDTLRKMVQKG